MQTPSTENQTRRILLVEDNADHAELIRRAFESREDGHRLSLADDLRGAREFLARTVPDLVIADYKLPDGCGVDLLPEGDEAGRFPLVIMTSHGNEKLAVAALKAGALDYVAKSDRAFADMPWIADRAMREWDNMVQRRQAEAEKEKLEARIRQMQKAEAIGVLAGGIAHDFNNILGIILGNTELALDDTPEWHPIRQNLEEVVRASLRAKDIVRQIMSFSRSAESEQKPVNMAAIVRASLKLIRSSLPSRIDIQATVDADAAPVLADPAQIHQIMINLCTNAAHAMPDGGSLDISLINADMDEATAARYLELPPGRYVKLTVSDTGHGIPDDVRDKIFDPYFTTREVGKGTGMGLAVVRGIVKNHGGAISVYSEPGGGASFRIFLPALEQPPDADAETVETLLTGAERILLVDDEIALAAMGKQMLQRLGYEVTAETNPLEALKMFRADPDGFDLVITDMTMPRMSGEVFVREIRRVRPDVPVILCTGFSEHINGEKAGTMGIDQYIEKPMNKNEIAAAVRNVMARRPSKKA